MTQHSDLTTERLAGLRQNLVHYFNTSELSTLCFDLGVDYADLRGEDKAEKIREFLAYLNRLGRIGDLIALCEQQRPNIDWKEWVKLSGVHSPYMGLQYFDTTDSALFFGRELLIAKLTDRLREDRFLAVVGASGSGKSSVVRAGIAATIGSGHWITLVITPTSHPLEALAVSLTRDSESVSATTTLMNDLAVDARSLHLYARKSMETRGTSNRLLIIVDQFEEMFTLCKENAERKAFIDNLLTATETTGPVTVVIALRADFYESCAKFPNLREALAKYQEYIGAMTLEELRQAIEEPAVRNGWVLEPGLVDVILGDVGSEPGALPFVSHALFETWNRRSGRILTLQGYMAAGGVRAAISKTAEMVFNQQLTVQQQPIARSIFLRLAEFNELAEITRRRATMEELTIRAEDAPIIEAVLKTLADARLIIREQGTAEIAHEALLNEWFTLQQWLKQDRPGLLIRQRLTDAANEWQRLSKDKGLLYRGIRLDEAQAWVISHPTEVNGIERGFLTASVVGRVSERRRTIVSWFAICIALLVALIAFAGPQVYRDVLRRQLRIQAQKANPLLPVLGGTMIFGTDSMDRVIPVEPVSQTVNLIAFTLNRAEVTNKEYIWCVQSTGCNHTPSNAKYYDDPNFADHPAVYLTAYQAAEYCAWLDRRLPTEYELEHAARGQDGRAWPWIKSGPLTSGHANLPTLNYEPQGSTPVGAFPSGASPEGVLDLAGNVMEWTRTTLLCDETTCARNDWDGKVNLPLAVQGGAWTFQLDRITEAQQALPEVSDQDIGFRCAQSSQK